ncbi:hypothetical protein MS3_00001375 [Schistosoma haematobium]|uniref:Uncharacterized protein n=1 Tax=Schistosoma haematobium TaxID=6185 RepID=A0A922LWJ4_SCHHA|nr:hypothetical protein MS3_00001375 [Schistosoma haematobium]KAH9595255.1 hypothetical protein MS3_00001375 [Schistosoma haematobium]
MDFSKYWWKCFYTIFIYMRMKLTGYLYLNIYKFFSTNDCIDKRNKCSHLLMHKIIKIFWIELFYQITTNILLEFCFLKWIACSWSFHRSSERYHQHKLQVEVKCSPLLIFLVVVIFCLKLFTYERITMTSNVI